MRALPDVLRAAGVPVQPRPGWDTRGRSSTPIRPKGIVAHDDVIAASVPLAARLNVLTYGFNALPGPLCHVSLTKDGTWHLLAVGRANHAGRGSWRGVDDGNGQMLGIECAWAPGESYPDAQIDSLVRGCAAVSRHFGFGVDMICHHREWAPRRKADMHWHGHLREAVGLHLLAAAGVTPAPVPWTPARSHVVARLKESTVEMFELVTPPLDSFGRGWLPLDGFDGRPLIPWGSLVSAIPQGSAPQRDAAYWPTPEVGMQQDGPHTLLTVQGGAPGTPAVLYLTVADT